MKEIVCNGHNVLNAPRPLSSERYQDVKGKEKYGNVVLLVCQGPQTLDNTCKDVVCSNLRVSLNKEESENTSATFERQTWFMTRKNGTDPILQPPYWFVLATWSVCENTKWDCSSNAVAVYKKIALKKSVQISSRIIDERREGFGFLEEVFEPLFSSHLFPINTHYPVVSKHCIVFICLF